MKTAKKYYTITDAPQGPFTEEEVKAKLLENEEKGATQYVFAGELVTFAVATVVTLGAPKTRKKREPKVKPVKPGNRKTVEVEAKA